MFPCFGISNFLEEISSLYHSIVFLYFFALITEKGFLFSPCYSWNSAFKWVYLSFSPLPLASLLFSAICSASSDNHFAFLHFFFFGMVLITASCTMSWASVHSSSGTLSDLIPWIYLSFPLYNCKTESHSVVSDSLPSLGLYSPRNSLSQDTGVGSLSFL